MKKILFISALVAALQVQVQDVSITFSSPFSLRDKGF
jgi:hypothetical protein